MTDNHRPTRVPGKRTRRRRSGRWRFWLGCAALVLLGAALWGYHAFTDPTRLRKYAEHYLGQIVATKVHVDAISFDLFDGIHLSGVAVEDPHDPSRAPVLSCDHVLLKHSPAAMLLGRLDVQEIVAVRPAFRAVFDEATHRFNIQDLFHQKPRSTRTMPNELPTVRMRDARVRFYRESDGAIRQIEELALNLVAIASPTGKRAYNISWSGETDRPSSGQCRLDLDQFLFTDLEGGTPWLSIDAAMTAVEASRPGAQRWIELLGLNGRFRAASHELSLRLQTLGDQRVTIEVDDASLSVPISEAEEDLPADQRYVRLENVSGRLELSEGDAIVHLTGQFQGSACKLEAHLYKPDADASQLVDAGIDLTIELSNVLLPVDDPVTAPAEARFIRRWKRLRDFYRDYDPHGRVSVSVALSKAVGPDKPFRINKIKATSLGADASCRHFPYRVSDLTGEVEITPDGVQLIGLSGTHDGGRVLVDGWMSAPIRSCAVDLHISGSDIPLDDSLCSGISGPFRSTWEMFDPQGAANLEIFLTRLEAPAGATAPWNTTIEASLLDAQAVFTGFPYPVDRLRGNVVIADNTIEVENLTGRCGEGSVTVWGEAMIAPAREQTLDLTVAAEDVTLDDRLLAAVTPPQRKALEALDPTGRVDVLAQLRRDPDSDKLAYALTAEMKEVGIRFGGLPVQIDGLDGRIDIGPDAIKFDDVTGRRGHGAVAIDGTIRDPVGARDLNLRVRCRDWTFDDELRGALPPAARDALAEWNLAGTFSAESTLSGSSRNRVANLFQKTTIALAGLTARHALVPLPFGLSDGELTIEGHHIELHRLVARHGDAAIAVDGDIELSADATTARLAIDANSLAFTNEMRLAMPWRIRRAWNDVRPAGSIDIHVPKLTYRRSGDTPPHWRIDGNIAFNDVDADLGARLRHASGTASVAGVGTGALHRLSLAGKIDLNRITINDHQVENLKGPFVRDGESGRWRFANLNGAVYGGTLSLAVEAEPEDPGIRFDVQAGIQRMALEGFVNATRGPDSPLPKVDMTGYVDCKLYRDGIVGDLASQRGGGQFAIRDAELYRLPLPLAILHVINLSMPEASAFQAADADFYIVGNEVQLQNIVLRGSALAMIGGGTMKLPAQELDLTLVTVSPYRWAKLPVVTELLEGAARELIEVHVTGTPQAPKATAKPLHGIQEALDALFSPKRPRAPLGRQADRRKKAG